MAINMNKRADDILNHTENRNYPLPPLPWKYFQQWQDVLMLHWEVPAANLHRLLPLGISLDTIDGKAWISLVIFSVKNMKARSLSLPDFIGSFEEINLRTYVKKDGIAGIYMFSIETNKKLVAAMTRLLIGVPYMSCTIKKRGENVISSNPLKGNNMDIKTVRTGVPFHKTDLDYWLTERHSLYVHSERTWHRHDIHHKEWPLESCDIKVNNLQYHAGYFSSGHVAPHRIHFCPTIDVLLWPRKKMD
jgi:uncharacterized protein YqjF (DUF2071 family)